MLSFFVYKNTNFDDQIIVSNLTSGVYKFQLTVIDTIGQSDSTKVTVLVLTPEQSQREYPDPKCSHLYRTSFPSPGLKLHINTLLGISACKLNALPQAG